MTELSRSWVILLRSHVLSLLKELKDLSASHDEAGHSNSNRTLKYQSLIGGLDTTYYSDGLEFHLTMVNCTNYWGDIVIGVPSNQNFGGDASPPSH